MYGSNGPVGEHDVALTRGMTVVVGRKGSFGEVHLSRGPCWPIDTTYYIDESATECDLGWLSYTLRQLRLTDLNRAAAVPGLNREDAYRQRLLLPSLDEQRRIAGVLDGASELRTRRRDFLSRATELVQADFAETFREVVATRPLMDVVMPDRPITYGILKPGADVADGIPYVRVVDIQDGAIRTDEIRRTSQRIAGAYKRSTLAAGDLVMSIRGHVGRLAIVPRALEGANITQDSARTRRPRIRAPLRHGVHPVACDATMDESPSQGGRGKGNQSGGREAHPDPGCLDRAAASVRGTRVPGGPCGPSGAGPPCPRRRTLCFAPTPSFH